MGGVYSFCKMVCDSVTKEDRHARPHRRPVELVVVVVVVRSSAVVLEWCGDVRGERERERASLPARYSPTSRLQ
jgi:hypothetical protein